MATIATATWCTQCWIKDRRRQLATVEVDEDPMCEDHRKAAGYSETEGKRLAPVVVMEKAPPSQPEPTAVKHEDLVGALINQGLKKKRAKELAEHALRLYPEASIEELFRVAISQKDLSIAQPKEEPVKPAEKETEMVKRTWSTKRRELDEDMVRELRADGMGVATIARQLGCSASPIKRILDGSPAKKKRGRPPKKETAKAANGAAASAPAVNGHAADKITVEVTEVALDRFWQHLSLKEKGSVFSRYIVNQ
jgi:hypothetical protein